MLHIVIPTHNRQNMIQELLTDLRKQKFDFQIYILDSSTDDSLNFLCKMMFADLQINYIKTHEECWWTESIAIAQKVLRIITAEDDRVLLINDDVNIPNNYLRDMNHICDELGPDVVVGSELRLKDDNLKPIENYIELNSSSFEINHKYIHCTSAYNHTDLITGRGAIYPANFFVDTLVINYEKLPQHLADLNLSWQAKVNGIKLVIATSTYVKSNNEFGSTRLQRNLFIRIFSIESSERLPSHLFFWRNVHSDKHIIYFYYLFFIKLFIRKIRQIRVGKL